MKHNAHLCGTCRAGYAHGPLGGLGEVAPTFTEAVSAAEAALRSLDARSKVLAITATDSIKMEIASKASRLANITGPMSIQRANATGDWDELRQLQQGIRGVTDVVGDELRSSLIDRFLLLPLALMPARVFATIKDGVKSTFEAIPTPTAEDIPWYFYVGGAVVAVGVVGYTVRAFK